MADSQIRFPVCVCGHAHEEHANNDDPTCSVSRCGCDSYTPDPLAEFQELGDVPDDKPEGGGSIRG
jgi:hypothetical protein